MSLFRRRKASGADEHAAGPEQASGPGADSSSQPDGTGAGAASADEAGAARGDGGPYDESEVHDDIRRVDLGSLRLPPRAGMELRLELADKTKDVVAVTVGLNGSTVQLQAFAAPRRQGVWDDIRSEIAAQVTRSGGTADEIVGAFGRELLARLPVRTSDGRTAHRPTRFVGVDGPRWFLRAVFSGPAAADETAAAPLEDVVRGTVVVRGSDAMAPRDLLPLKLPAGSGGDGAPTQVATSDGGAGAAPPAGVQPPPAD